MLHRNPFNFRKRTLNFIIKSTKLISKPFTFYKTRKKNMHDASTR